VIGWAMVGRAEFAYLIAQMGQAAGMIEDKLFSQLIWALLWATIFAPLVFRYVLNKYIKDAGIVVAGKDTGSPSASAEQLPPAPGSPSPLIVGQGEPAIREEPAVRQVSGGSDGPQRQVSKGSAGRRVSGGSNGPQRQQSE